MTAPFRFQNLTHKINSSWSEKGKGREETRKEPEATYNKEVTHFLKSDLLLS